MKKFTLTLIASAVVFSGMAQKAAISKVASLQNPKMEIMAAKKNYKMFSELKTSAVQHESLKATLGMKSTKATVLRQPMAKEPVQATRAYMFGGIMEAEVLGGTTDVNMVESMIATTTEDGAELLLLDLWGLEYAIAGVIIPGENMFSEIGADSVAFLNNQVILSAENGIGEDIVVTSVNFSRDASNKPVMTRSESKAFGGYFFRENSEVYIPELVGCFTATGTEPLTYSDTPTYANMDIIGGLDEYMTKANITGVDGTTPVNIEGKALIMGGNLYVQGALFDMPDMWYNMTATETNLVGGAWQWIGMFKSGPAVTGYAIPADQPGYYNCGLSDITYTMDTDLDDNLLIAPAADQPILAGLVVSNGSNGNLSLAGICSLSDGMEIVVTNEPATGIKGVSTESGKVAAKEYFDLSGRKVESSAKGLVIEKVRYTDGKTVSRKVIK